MDQSHPFLRHMLATLGYRGTKVIAGAPAGFANTKASPSGRSALEILSHINDLLNWIGWLGRGEKGYPGTKPQDWIREVETFYDRLKALDDWLATNPALQCDPKNLLQGPIADTLTHIGQLAMLSRLAGSPIRGEDYSAAKISIGNVGPDQPAPVTEFD